MSNDIDCLLTQIENYQITTLTKLEDEEEARLYDYEYPLVKLNTGYSPYENNLSTLLAQAFADTKLYDRAYETYGWRYNATDVLKDETNEIFKELKTYYVPQSCKGVKNVP